MGKYEDLIIKNNHLPITETNRLPHFQSGFYMNGEIFINENKSTTSKLEALAEELAHHDITYGNILDCTQIQNRKYELKARRLASEILIPLEDIINAFKNGVHNLYELSEFLEVSENFIIKSLEHYKQKHGLNTRCGDYVITFEPLRVFEYKNIN